MGKKIKMLLIIFCLLVTVPGIPKMKVSAAKTQQETELSGKKTCTIKKKNGKWYYYNKNGNRDTGAGWKKNASGDYTYYVGRDGYATAKLTAGKYYKWSKGKWRKVSLSKYSKRTKTLNGKSFYITQNGNVSMKAGWKSGKGRNSYYVGRDGVVSYRVTENKLQRYSKGRFGTINKKLVKIGNRIYKTRRNKTTLVKSGVIVINNYVYIVVNGKAKSVKGKSVVSAREEKVYVTGKNGKYIGSRRATEEEVEKAKKGVYYNEEDPALECEHCWEFRYKTVHHKAVTHTEKKTTYTEEEVGTVGFMCQCGIFWPGDPYTCDCPTCHGCGTTWTEWTTEKVPHTETVVVVDKPAWDETVKVHYCINCGIEK